MGTFYVCKMCGRSVIAESKPNFCYYDRMSSIENISEEDSKKMGLFSTNTFLYSENNVTFEFPKDIRFDPFTGEEMSSCERNYKGSLTDFQDEIMKRVRE